MNSLLFSRKNDIYGKQNLKMHSAAVSRIWKWYTGGAWSLGERRMQAAKMIYLNRVF